MAAKDIIMVGIIVFMFATVFFVTHFATKTIMDQMIDIPVINASTPTVEALQGSEVALDKLDYVVFGIFMALVLGIIVTGYLVGGSPVFMAIYFLSNVVAVVMSAILSNVWESITQAAAFGSEIAAFPIANNLMLNAPIYMAGVGFVGMIVMFAKPYFTRGGEY